VALAKRLYRASPKTGKRMSLRKISAQLAESGNLNERGRPSNQRTNDLHDEPRYTRLIRWGLSRPLLALSGH